MSGLEKAIDRIKILECPTGDLENRVAGILEDYKVAKRNEIIVNRDEESDRDGAQAYSTIIPSNRQQIIVLATSGLDDYVAKVVDAYID